MPSAAELRELQDDELYNRLAESRRELMNLRFQLATGQLDNAARIGLVKKDVARILTLLRDREIALAEGRDAGPVFRAPREFVAERPPARRRTRARAADEELDEQPEDESDAAVVEDEVDDEVDDEVSVDEAEDAEEDE